MDEFALVIGVMNEATLFVLAERGLRFGSISSGEDMLRESL